MLHTSILNQCTQTVKHRLHTIHKHACTTSTRQVRVWIGSRVSAVGWMCQIGLDGIKQTSYARGLRHGLHARNYGQSTPASYMPSSSSVTAERSSAGPGYGPRRKLRSSGAVFEAFHGVAAHLGLTSSTMYTLFLLRLRTTVRMAVATQQTAAMPPMMTSVAELRP